MPLPNGINSLANNAKIKYVLFGRNFRFRMVLNSVDACTECLKCIFPVIRHMLLCWCTRHAICIRMNCVYSHSHTRTTMISYRFNVFKSTIWWPPIHNDTFVCKRIIVYKMQSFLSFCRRLHLYCSTQARRTRADTHEECKTMSRQNYCELINLDFLKIKSLFIVFGCACSNNKKKREKLLTALCTPSYIHAVVLHQYILFQLHFPAFSTRHSHSHLYIYLIFCCCWLCHRCSQDIIYDYDFTTTNFQTILIHYPPHPLSVKNDRAMCYVTTTMDMQCPIPTKLELTFYFSIAARPLPGQNNIHCSIFVAFDLYDDDGRWGRSLNYLLQYIRMTVRINSPDKHSASCIRQQTRNLPTNALTISKFEWCGRIVASVSVLDFVSLKMNFWFFFSLSYMVDLNSYPNSL